MAFETYLEFIQHFGEAIKLGLVPRRHVLIPQCYSRALLTPETSTDRFYLRAEGIQIDKQVNPCIRKRIHARFVIFVILHMVDPDGIGSQILHLLCITDALFGVYERIVGDKLICNP